MYIYGFTKNNYTTYNTIHPHVDHITMRQLNIYVIIYFTVGNKLVYMYPHAAL